MLQAIHIFLHGRERPVKDVPRPVWVILTVMLLLQIILSCFRSPVNPFVKPLPAPPDTAWIRLYSLNDAVAASRSLMLWLQAFDNQPGISIPFRQLDYEKVKAWLDTILQLDSRNQYPLLSAARIYTQVPDEYRQRLMLEFVFEKFHDDPGQRWPALAHAVYVAKHRLKDLPLALKYAKALTDNVTGAGVPFWVQQMQIYVLEDMDEIESARILIGGLLDSGAIKDEHELRFLEQRLKQLEAKAAEDGR